MDVPQTYPRTQAPDQTKSPWLSRNVPKSEFSQPTDKEQDSPASAGSKHSSLFSIQVDGGKLFGEHEGVQTEKRSPNGRILMTLHSPLARSNLFQQHTSSGVGQENCPLGKTALSESTSHQQTRTTLSPTHVYSPEQFKHKDPCTAFDICTNQRFNTAPCTLKDTSTKLQRLGIDPTISEKSKHCVHQITSENKTERLLGEDEHTCSSSGSFTSQNSRQGNQSSHCASVCPFWKHETQFKPSVVKQDQSQQTDSFQNNDLQANFLNDPLYQEDFFTPLSPKNAISSKGTTLPSPPIHQHTHPLTSLPISLDSTAASASNERVVPASSSEPETASPSSTAIHNQYQSYCSASRSRSERNSVSSIPEVVVPDSDIAQLWDEVRAVKACKMAAATSTASEAKPAVKRDLVAANLFEIEKFEKLPISLHNGGRPVVTAHEPPGSQLGHLKARKVIGRPNYTTQIRKEDADKIASVWKQQPRPILFQSVFFREQSCELNFLPLKLMSSTEAGDPTTDSYPEALPSLSVLRQFSFVNARTKTPSPNSDHSSQSNPRKGKQSPVENQKIPVSATEVPTEFRKLARHQGMFFGIIPLIQHNNTFLSDILTFPGEDVFCGNFLDVIFDFRGPRNTRTTWVAHAWRTLHTQLVNAACYCKRREQIEIPSSRIIPYEKEDILHNMHHFGYFFHDTGVEIWQVSPDFKPSNTSPIFPPPSKKSAKAKPDAGISGISSQWNDVSSTDRSNAENKVTAPSNNPAIKYYIAHRLCNLDLREPANVEHFQEYHTTIMTWGLVTHGTTCQEIMRDLCQDETMTARPTWTCQGLNDFWVGK